MKNLTHRFIIGTFVSLYLMVSVISTIHVIDFFELSNPYWLAVTLAIAFELGAAASLASLIVMEKMNKALIWALFITITLMQMQGNMYYAFKNITDYSTWSQLFNLIEEDPIYQKRILAFVSGAILPLVALGFIKSLVDYIKPAKVEEVKTEESLEERVEEMRNVVESYDDLQEEIDAWEKASLEDFIDKPVKLWVEDDNDEVVQEEPSIEESIPTVHSTLAPDKEPWDLRPIEEEPSIEEFEEVAESIEKSDENPDLLDIIESTKETPTEDKPKFDSWGYKIRD